MDLFRKIINCPMKYILLMITLVVMNVILAVILTSQSGHSMKSLIGSRMPDISNTAAIMSAYEKFTDPSSRDQMLEFVDIINVSSITAFRQLLFQSPQRGLWKALKIRFLEDFFNARVHTRIWKSSV